MSRVRVLELAKELGIETKVAIMKLQELGIQVKNHFNALSETDAAKLRAFHRLGKNPEKEAAQKAAAGKIFIRRKVESPTIEHPVDDADFAKVDGKEFEGAPFEAPNSFLNKTDADTHTSHEQPRVPETVTPIDNQNESPEEFVAQPSHGALQTEKVPRTAQNDPVEPQYLEAQEETKVHQGQTPIAQHAKESQLTGSEGKAEVSSMASGIPSTLQPAKPPQEGAVVVRRAPPPPASPPPVVHRPTAKPQSYTTAGFSTQGGYRREETRQGTSSTDAYPQRREEQRPGGAGAYTTQSAQGNRNQFGSYSTPSRDTQGQMGMRQGGPRPPGAGEYNNGYGSGTSSRAGSSPGGGRPFGGVDTPSITPTKDVPSRLKDRDKDKDREKRRIEDEETARKNSLRAKGIRQFEEDVDDLGDGESTDEVVAVRTVIPNRKKSSGPARRKELRKTEVANPTKASKKIIRVDETVSVNDLAGELSQKVTAVIKTLMKLGMMATVNQQLDIDTATFVAQEFGFEVQSSSVSIGDILTQKTDKLEELNLSPRPPIITIMGHVDHGKTSLLDAIRSANVAAKEVGGITQHIGAYQIDYNGRKLTFLDTPGHEAFTSMRARGAQVTDLVVLVVAADDGVMPQTIEAIAHAKAANVPIIVAINKIDKPGINLDRINRELADKGVLPEEWGGDSMFVQVSAKTRQGLNNLIEAILLQADVLDLKATKEGLAEGIVIEAKLDKARGPVATVIVTKGTLRIHDFVVVGKCMGRIRAMNDDRAQKIQIAEPAIPVEIIGLDAVPAAGDQFNSVASDAIAKEAVAYRVEKQRKQDLTSSQRGTSTVEEMLAMIGNTEEKPKEVNIIIKADMHGSSEAIRNSIQKLDTPKVKNKILHSAVGGITETDVILAKASNAMIVGFNVRPDRVAAQVAEQSGIKIQCFGIIYELIEAVQAAMVGALAPIKLDKVIGHAEVRNTFSVPKVGVIAGSMVTDGKVVRNAHVRVVRDGIVIYTGRVGSLKRFKDDAKEVMQGFECGLGVENYNDLKIGDVLEVYVIEEIAATLN